LVAGLGSYAFVIKPALEQKGLEAERARQEQQMALEQKERAQQDPESEHPVEEAQVGEDREPGAEGDGLRRESDQDSERGD
jgi:hypothetical protein